MDALTWIVESVTEAAAGILVLCVAIVAVCVGAWQGVERAFRPRRRC
ncbi:hypothetical protein [Anatilimnocola floriformis]|nr:hypothetical protein [Anatilimnocola floriformis]